MNSGKACKNLTDGMVLAMAFLALLGLVLAVLAFEGEYLMTDPITGEDLRVEKPLDDPYASTYLRLFIAFGITAVIGFASRKFPLAGILGSICTVVISVNYFADEMIKSFPFLYVLTAVASVAGNAVYTYFHYTENRKPKAAESNGKKRSDNKKKKK